MGRITDAFSAAKKDGRAALVIYLCAGDPDLRTTVELVLAAADAGADVIELGMPFSDPTADGPAIQRASERAINNGATLSGVLGVVEKVRAQSQVPIVLFGYYNPIFHYGEKKAVRDAKTAGADGFLVVDLPPENCGVLRDALIAEGMDYIPLIAPTSDSARVKLAASVATSFVYYVSMTGVTGAAITDLDESGARAGALQKEIHRPIALGFGVKSKEDVSTVAKHVDGVIVGSAVVRVIEEASDSASAISAVRALVRSLRSGT